MMSLRTLARSAPRTLARASSSLSSRTPSTLLRTTRTTPLAARTQQISAFSTTMLRPAAKKGEVDAEVSEKLASEIQFEKEVRENEPQPPSIKDFLENSKFTLEDVPGKEDVYLRRTFGEEKITVSFSISDLHNMDQDMMEDDNILEDADLEEAEAARNTENQEGEEGAEDDEPGHEAPVPVRLNIVIEKPNQGALNIEALAQDGSIVFDNFYYYADPKLAHSTDANAVHEAQDTYPGPPFGSLDEDLQVLMERYLEERGITQGLALFVPDYMDYKEQKEYTQWLKNVKAFIDA
ncbi:mitochondrial glycoprotein [Chaetomium sp. MPI-SDFR-AT-0129]|nr:mitochondrial glycoprotein [Chaetomium sp. MPI-SDFR-AT-0129]